MYLSWITLEDLVGAVQFLIGTESIEGVVNMVAPDPVTNRAFTAALARALGKPAIFVMPAWVLNLFMGQIAEEAVLSSVRAVPRRLLESGFPFRDPSLQTALTGLLSRDRR